MNVTTNEIKLPFDLSLPPSKVLKAGELTCIYETGNLRYLSIGKTELVRKIYSAVRKEDWTTVPYRIENETVTAHAAGFSINYTAIYFQDIDIYKAEFAIEGAIGNIISFSMKGTALTPFERNRIGLCLLHPLKECRGNKLSVTNTDGVNIEAIFPELVHPSLPCVDIKQLQWVSENGITVAIAFEGDVFETEDQRNWSDGSYKTYSTRSDLPRPVAVKKGDTIKQKITVRISDESSTGLSTPNDPEEIKIAFPQIGYKSSGADLFRNQESIKWLLNIPFDHLRVSIHMDATGWRQQLQDALVQAAAVNTRLELVVFFSDAYKDEVPLLVSKISDQQLLVRSLLPLQQSINVTPADLIQYLYPIVKSELPAILVGYGTDGMFVDVNENRPSQMEYDFLSFGLHPQAHATDNRSILENLQSHPDITKTAIDISGGLPVCIAPVTIGENNAGGNNRTHSSMAAFWTLVSLQNLSEAYSITYHELSGPEGLLDVIREVDDKLTIKPTPLYELLASIARFQPAWIIKRFIGNELIMDGLLLENEKEERLFLKGPDEYVFATEVR